MKVKLELDLPEEYLEYDDIENLWYWGVSENRTLIANPEDFNSDESVDINKIVDSISSIMEEKSDGVIFKWIKGIIEDCDQYYVENVHHLDGGNFILTYGLINISLLKDDEVIKNIQKSLDELIFLSSEEIMTVDLKVSESTIGQSEIEKIKNILEKLFEEDERLSIFDLPKHYEKNGYEMLKTNKGGPLRFEIKVNDSYFTLCNEGVAPEKVEFKVGYISGFNGGGDW